jgi:hypothetical protein
MKKLANTISPYLLLLIPVFIALVVLLVNQDQDALEQSVQLRASFIKMPDVNLFKVVVDLFKSLPLWSK